ncbi:shTK domain protein [Oesophagostomum dentatum]|uniref:ShTK domain protein n=1 Tax=Oesophagostomum dentatum TaxID=61180 RepID=A0A0B1S6D6_OESDE|nr:shTK domain protein [Oesophagostomum dentatum]
MRELNSGGTADEQMKQLAISACPLTCGYCCLTPAYKCANKQFPRIACAALTSDMCKDPTWKQIIAEDCPNICGFCQEGEIHKVFLRLSLAKFKVTTNSTQLRLAL